MPSLGDQLLEPGQVGRRRLGVGGEAGDRLEVQAVAGEVGERLVADDGRRALARAPGRRRTPGPGPPAPSRSSAALSSYVAAPSGSSSTSSSATASPRSAISSGSCQKWGSRSPWSWPSSSCSSRSRPRARRRASARPRRPRRRSRRRAALASTVSSTAGWKSCSSTIEVGLREGRGLRDVEGEVVRLRARPGEVGDLPPVARHPIGHPGQRVERGDGRATIPGAVVGPRRSRQGERPRRGRWRGRSSGWRTT